MDGKKRLPFTRADVAEWATVKAMGGSMYNPSLPGGMKNGQISKYFHMFR